MEKTIHARDGVHISLFVPVVEDEYDGPRLSENGVTEEFVGDLIERFTNQKKIHKKYAYEVNHKKKLFCLQIGHFCA